MQWSYSGCCVIRVLWFVPLLTAVITAIFDEVTIITFLQFYVINFVYAARCTTCVSRRGVVASSRFFAHSIILYFFNNSPSSSLANCPISHGNKQRRGARWEKIDNVTLLIFCHRYSVVLPHREEGGIGALSLSVFLKRNKQTNKQTSSALISLVC